MNFGQHGKDNKMNHNIPISTAKIRSGKMSEESNTRYPFKKGGAVEKALEKSIEHDKRAIKHDKEAIKHEKREIESGSKNAKYDREAIKMLKKDLKEDKKDIKYDMKKKSK